MDFRNKIVGAVAASSGVVLMAGTALAISLAMNSFQTALIPIEGGGAGFSAVNPNTNALGAFQMTPVALRDIGWQDANGNWTPAAQAAGVTSTSDFLSNPAAQVAADNAYNQNNINYLGSTYTQRLGTVDAGSGATLTQGNLAYCAEALGAGGCQQYLATGQVPPNELVGNPQWANGGFQNNMNSMGGTSLGDTGNVNVNTTQSLNPDGTSTSTTTVNGVFCDPAIMQAALQAGQNMTDNWTKLAEMPGTGYTMLGGQSVLEAAGLLQPGQPGYVGQSGMFGGLTSATQGTPLGGASFAMASCLNNLMGSGLNIIFSPMSIDQILNAILAAACSMAMQLFSEVTMPINQSVYQAFSFNNSLPMGLNPGAIGGGMGMYIAPGAAANGGLINLNAGNYGSYSMNPSTSWYGSNGQNNQQTTTIGGNQTSYGSLLGTITTTQQPTGSGSSLLQNLIP